MEPFVRLQGPAAPLVRPNIDTDAIIPSREMKRVSKIGLSDGLFANWRYADVAARTEAPDFVLNREGFRGAPILIAGHNFGCGSSREHAVWALQEYGVLAIIAPSFGAIFQGNSVRNGVLTAVIPEEQVLALAAEAEARPGAAFTVDLPAQTITTPSGFSASFEVAESDKAMLLEGLDQIGVTLKRKAQIDAFEAAYRAERPWRRLDLSAADGPKLDRPLPR
jgi:3-isopropylmalate/(R)-2-methylmalate dehydratase small subunit